MSAREKDARLRRAVLAGGRSHRHDVRVALHDRVGVAPVETVEQRREAVEMVEVLEHAEAIDLGHVGIGLELRDRGGHLDRGLLVRDRGLERRLVGRAQPTDERLLLVLDATDTRRGHAQDSEHPSDSMEGTKESKNTKTIDVLLRALRSRRVFVPTAIDHSCRQNLTEWVRLDVAFA